MQSFLLLYDDLKQCYSRNAKYSEDYLKLSLKEREELCQKERARLIFHLNSDQMIFENILKERLRWMKKPLFPDIFQPLYDESEWRTSTGEL